jgi:hypothetical protein
LLQYWQGLVSASMMPLSFSPRTAMRLVRPSLHGMYAWTSMASGCATGRPGDAIKPCLCISHLASCSTPRVAPCCCSASATPDPSTTAIYCIDRNQSCRTLQPRLEHDHAHWCGCRGKHNPLVESRVQSAGKRSPQRWVLGVGYRLPAVVINGAGPAAPGLYRSRWSFLLWVGCVLSQICLHICRATRTP